MNLEKIKNLKKYLETPKNYSGEFENDIYNLAFFNSIEKISELFAFPIGMIDAKIESNIECDNSELFRMREIFLNQLKFFFERYNIYSNIIDILKNIPANNEFRNITTKKNCTKDDNFNLNSIIIKYNNGYNYIYTHSNAFENIINYYYSILEYTSKDDISKKKN